MQNNVSFPMSLKLLPVLLVLYLFSFGVCTADQTFAASPTDPGVTSVNTATPISSVSVATPTASPDATNSGVATPGSAAPDLANPVQDASNFSDPYDIEIIVFERETPTDERWPANPGQPPIDQAVGNLSVPGESGPDVEILPPQDDKLDALVEALQQHGAIIHAHVRWRQDIPDQDHASWYQIGDDTMGGVIRISKGRFLHFEADLLLKQPAAQTQEGQPSDAQQPNAQQPDTQPSGGQPPSGPPPVVRLQLQARMRSGELHYLDHPLGGILIEADRVDTNPPADNNTPQQAPPPPPAPPKVEAPPAQPRGSMPRATPDNS